MTGFEETVGRALRGESDVVRALWDADAPRLTVALENRGTHAEDYREPNRRLGSLLLPLLGPLHAVLACGPEYGVMPTATGVVVYERGAA